MWLYVVLVVLVVAAAVGIVPLRRYQDRQWAEYVARERYRHFRTRWIVAMPAMVKIAADFERLQKQIGEALMPATGEAVKAIARLQAELDRQARR